MTVLPVNPNQARAAWVEAERVRRAEALLQMDGPLVCATRRRAVLMDVDAYSKNLARRRAEERAS